MNKKYLVSNSKNMDKNDEPKEKSFQEISKKIAKKNYISKKDLVQLKKARIIIRNLPFGICEEELENQFGKFGEIYEIVIPKSNDGKMKGFAFINFRKTMYAIKALKEMNGKILKSDKFTRTIAVDFALSKRQYEDQILSTKEIKIRTHTNNDLINKERNCDRNEKKIDKKNISKSNKNSYLDQDDIDETDEEKNNSLSENRNEIDEELNNENEDLKNNFQFIKQKNKQIVKKSTKSNDIIKGKTLFITNLSYDSTKEDLSTLMEQFGPLEYCLLCIDKVTEKSKGTAFVKFKNKEDADKCLQKFENKEENEDLFYLDGRVIYVQLGISKNNLELKSKEKEKIRDKRNLYLLKEGLIYPDSPSAKNVSPNDLKKRLNLIKSKKKQLENFHYFVSKNRLCVHNLHENCDDKQLYNLCWNIIKKDQDAKILFCKVMKNKDKITNTFGTSKGFGFVSFSTHKHALRVLRSLNNNPDIFTKDKRPIVEFSIENINAIKKNHQYIIKECLDSNLEEVVQHPWAGYQSQTPIENMKNINPFKIKGIKQKEKDLHVKAKDLKKNKNLLKEKLIRNKFIKHKTERIKENKILNKPKKELDPISNLEERYLSKPKFNEIKKNIKKNSNKIVKKKWFS